jgi:LPXTG-motif cell wall-anchored protein
MWIAIGVTGALITLVVLLVRRRRKRLPPR